MILLVSHDYTSTGAPRALLSLAKILKSLGEKIVILAFKGGDMKKDFKELKVPVITIKEKKLLKILFLLRIFKLIICNTIVTHKLVKKLSDKKFNVLWWIHEAHYFEEVMKKSSEEKRNEYINALKACKQVYCVSEYSKSFFEEYNPDIKILNLYVRDEYEKFADIKEEKNDKFNILYIGEESLTKGQDRFLKYFSELDKDVRDKFKIQFAGGEPVGDYLKLLETIITPDMDIEFLPRLSHDEIMEKLKKSNAFALFSRGDSFSIATAEAMMMDKPVLISEEVGIRNIVESENAGFVIKDEEEFKSAIQKLLQNSKDCVSSPREAFLKHFSKENYTNYMKEMILKMR